MAGRGAATTAGGLAGDRHHRSTAVSFQHPQLQWLALDITDGAQRDALVRQLGDAPLIAS